MAQASTQQFLEVDEIKEGLLILKDKSIHTVLMVSSQNFALQSAEEQEAIIYQFQNFLNSLDFPIQIVVQSRKLNITGYLEYLKNLELDQTDPMLKQQTTDYRAFVEKLIQGGSIMSKNFFVVVPFYLLETNMEGVKKGGVFSQLGGAAKRSGLTDEQFERMKTQLWERMEFVAAGLQRSGLKVVPLNTEELIELLWSWHHPDEAEVGYYPSIPPELTTEYENGVVSAQSSATTAWPTRQAQDEQ